MEDRETMSRNDSRSHFWLAFASAVTVLTLSGCSHVPGRPGPDPEVVRPAEILNFKTLYQQNCSGCHGANGTGGAAVSLGSPVYQALVDDATLRWIITNGLTGTAMPAFARSAGGTLTDQQIDVLVHGMRARWANPSALGGDTPPPRSSSTPGNAARGAGVFQTSCAMCHGPVGRGGAVAGSIVNGSFLALMTNQELRTMIIVGVPGTAMPDWHNHAHGPMSSQEMSDVVAWLAAQRRQFPGQPYPSSSSTSTGGSR
jgi:cytochrome c oxidase cbb3-type subunit III